MSVKAMSYAWDTEYTGSTKLTLLAIADHCDDYGECYPGIKRLAEKVGVSIRTIQRIVRDLEKLGEIITIFNHGVDTKHGKTNRYYMARFRETIGLSPPDGVTPTSPQGATSMSPLNPNEVTPTSPQGATPMSPKPSVEPSESESDDTFSQTPNVFRLYEEHTGRTLNPALVDHLKDLVSEHGEQAVVKAMQHRTEKVGQGNWWGHERIIWSIKELQRETETPDSTKAIVQALTNGYGYTPSTVTEIAHRLKDTSPEEVAKFFTHLTMIRHDKIYWPKRVDSFMDAWNEWKSTPQTTTPAHVYIPPTSLPDNEPVRIPDAAERAAIRRQIFGDES